MNVWLDDVRDAPAGWVHCRTIEQVQSLFLSGNIPEYMSLDHDLGYAIEFLQEELLNTAEDGVIVPAKDVTYNKTGYDLVKWMAEHNHWPKNKPTVHSMNPTGRANMLATIDRYFPKGNDGV